MTISENPVLLSVHGALTYKQLYHMAVAPNERGAYSDSPLGPGIGLHVHGDDLDVHVYVAGFGKIAEVYPDRTNFLYGPASMPDRTAQVLWHRLPDHDK